MIEPDAIELRFVLRDKPTIRGIHESPVYQALRKLGYKPCDREDTVIESRCHTQVVMAKK